MLNGGAQARCMSKLICDVPRHPETPRRGKLMTLPKTLLVYVTFLPRSVAILPFISFSWGRFRHQVCFPYNMWNNPNMFGSVVYADAFI